MRARRAAIRFDGLSLKLAAWAEGRGELCLCFQRFLPEQKLEKRLALFVDCYNELQSRPDSPITVSAETARCIQKSACRRCPMVQGFQATAASPA
jgi:hypothetical protein